ncbi:hypothetical protein FAZ15_21985 [Sphingobacterium olei]|uniref:DUF5977 domain-containing protein n=2 Tax=Sphingobacterium olei TaxID=2571155 RepID=A0A4U0N8F7_9SPHI|nr:hypothetical protein FAZ15_21985 [Sphingobacterium olei]
MPYKKMNFNWKWIRIALAAFFYYAAGFTISLAQDFSPVPLSKPSPNASSLGIYGEIPVSLYTGVPDIRIPIHTLGSSGIEVPISLSYHAGGFRPDEHPSWVGAGFSLHGGGVITRQVRNVPDENGFGFDLQDFSGRGFYETHSVLGGANWAATSTHNIPNGNYIDREPDVFVFNFLGYSGEFFLDHTGEWRVRSDFAIKVEFEQDDFIYKFPAQHNVPVSGSVYSSRTFNKFVLTDDKGNKYVFGTSDAIEYSVGFTPYMFDYVFSSIATSWYLVKIIPQVGEEIDFVYERGPYQSSFSYFEDGSRCYDYYVEQSASFGRVRFGLVNNQANGLSGSLISPVYLTKIESPGDNLEMHFHRSKSNELRYPESLYTRYFANSNYHNNTPNNPIPGEFLAINMTNDIEYFVDNPGEAVNNGQYSSRIIWLKLDSISFTHKSSFDNIDLKSKNVRFYYDESPDRRLRLDSVAVGNYNTVERGIFRFSYNDIGNFPLYATQITDHWGYHNYIPLVDTGDPNVYMFFGAGVGQDRSPAVGASLLGLLKEITYPTGGRTKFTYENHNYSEVVSSEHGSTGGGSGYDETAGGARIKRIENFDQNGGLTFKQFYYVEDFNPRTLQGRRSSGILAREPKYNYSYDAIINGSPVTLGGYMSSSIVPLTGNSTKSHIGYFSVTVREQDGSFTTHDFSNQAHGNADIVPFYVFNPALIPNIPFSSRDFERGRPLRVFKYGGDAMDYRMLEMELYDYAIVGENLNNPVRTVRLDFTARCDGGGGGNYFSGMTAYYNYTHAYLMHNYKKTSYLPSGTIVEEKTFGYNDHKQKTFERIHTSDNRISESRYTYPYTVSPSSGVQQIMNQKHMVSYPITAERYTDGIFKGGKRYSYNTFGSNGFVALSAIDDKLVDGSYTPEFVFTRYDQKGRLLESKEKGFRPSTYLYGYKNNMLVARIQGLDYDEVTTVVSVEGLSGQYGETVLDNTLELLHLDLPPSIVNSYTFHFDGQLRSIRNPSGKVEFFEYDPMRRLKDRLDMDKNILDNYRYNLRDENVPYNAYFNQTRSQYFTKNNCGTGYVGGSIEYIVPEGRYYSFISQADAEAKALQDVQQNGQAYANSNAACVVYIPPCEILLNSNWQLYSGHVYREPFNITIGFLMMQALSPGNYLQSDWYNNGVLIGSIDGDCVPTSTKYVSKTINGRDWVISLDAYGNIRIRIQNTNASIPSVGEVLEFTDLVF